MISKLFRFQILKALQHYAENWEIRDYAREELRNEGCSRYKK